MQRLTAATFDAALREFDHLVVNFSADWCPDCRRIKDAYAAFPERFPQLHFAVVDTDASPDLAERFDVRGIPTLLVFRKGDLVDRLYSRDAKTVRQVEEFVAKQVAVTR
ncbi:MAG: thioredoxin family protein [Symbiobacterium sp.]|uniref:thioredoxin family protein n=1 Tax=Symbiobacterium sp. TaxID=1971213 RepID=UPI003464C37E